MSNNKLCLTKTYDYCKSEDPRLTVVMIHGIASDSHSYNRALEYFRDVNSLENVRFVTFDLLGSGKSLKDDALNYDYHDQIEALHNAILELRLKTPLVMVGHSLGTFIATKYADTYKKSIKKLILISPPIYTEKDLDDPLFAVGMEGFKNLIKLKNKNILEEKSFNNSIEKIVMHRNNYKTLANLKTPTVLIYGDQDEIIAAYNMPKIQKDNPEYITITKTTGRHGVSRDKYLKIQKILEEMLDAKNL